MKLLLPLFVAAVVTASLSPAFSEDKQMWADSIIDKKAPRLRVEKWVTDKPDTTGKFVLIDFWATWCPPCRKAIPELNAFQEKFKDKLVVIGISDEPKKKIEDFNDPKPLYSLAIDSRKKMYNEINVSGIPHVLLIDPSGIVRWEGFPFLTGHELTEAVVADIIQKYDVPAQASAQ
jgi:thiol-disulfide isomerase/thioredoxin